MLRAVSVKVLGRVQRVGYRRHVLEVAQELGLAGYVRNELDGSVIVFVQGEDGLVDSFLSRIRSPPPPAVVREIVVEEVRPRPRLKAFQIMYGRLADELQEGFGAMQAIFTDYRGEFRDFRQEFREFRQEFRDFRQEFREFRQEFRDFRDVSLKLSGEILGEVRGLRSDLKTMLDERLARLERDIAEIKARLGLS
ncbi:MAG: acylphosphatase [Nitrososphaerota archaeon]